MQLRRLGDGDLFAVAQQSYVRVLWCLDAQREPRFEPNFLAHAREREPARVGHLVVRDVAASLAERVIYKGAISGEVGRERALHEHVRVQLLEGALVAHQPQRDAAADADAELMRVE